MTKKQEKKKKAREQKGRARSAARRHKLGEIRRGEERSRRLDMKFREKIKPVIKDPEKAAAAAEVEKKRSLEKLQRNMEIHEALEGEYVKEQEKKGEINAELEAEGHVTLQEKLRAMEQKARTIMENQEPEKIS
jgi:hypothetical protein